MNFLKTLFWIVLTVVAVLFASNNWIPIEVKLWGGLIWETKKAFLMLLFFLLGLIPAVIYYRTKNWRLRRRLDATERELSDIRALQQFRTPATEPATLVPAPAEQDDRDGKYQDTPPGAET